MKTKDLLKVIFTGTGTTIICNIDSIISFISRLFSITQINNTNTNKTMENTILTMSNSETYLRIAAIIITFILALIILYKFSKHNIKVNIMNDIALARYRNIFISKGYENTQYYILPRETEEHFFERIPDGQFLKNIKQEYFDIKKMIINKYNMPPSKAEKILHEIYNIKENNKHN